MIARHVEEFALVADLVNLLGMGEDARVAVAHDRALLPAALPELVEHLDIFVGDFVAVVVGACAGLADILGAALEIGRDDVPADAPLGVMIGGRQAPGERIGMLEGGRGGDADAEMLRGERDRRDELQRDR